MSEKSWHKSLATVEIAASQRIRFDWLLFAKAAFDAFFDIPKEPSYLLSGTILHREASDETNIQGI